MTVDTKIVLQDGNLVVGRSQDCTAIVEMAHQQRVAGNVGSSDMKFAGRIPDVEVEKYCNTYGVSYAEFIGNPVHVKAWLNNPDNKHYRIWEGRV